MNRVEKLFKYLSVLIMAFIIITVLLQIIAREIVYFPVSWTQEAANFSFIWMSLIGAGLGIRKLTHVSIDIVTSMFPNKIQRLIDYLVNIGMIVLMFFLFIQSINLSNESLGQNSPSLNLPMQYIYVALILFSLLGIIFPIERIVKMVRNKNQ